MHTHYKQCLTQLGGTIYYCKCCPFESVDRKIMIEHIEKEHKNKLRKQQVIKTEGNNFEDNDDVDGDKNFTAAGHSSNDDDDFGTDDEVNEEEAGDKPKKGAHTPRIRNNIPKFTALDSRLDMSSEWPRFCY